MGKFAFIINPPEAADITRRFNLAGCLPGPVVEGVLRLAPPLKVADITGIKSPRGEARGWIVAVPLTDRQMLALPERLVARRILQAGRKAERLGAGVIGLGNLPFPAGKAKLVLENSLKIAVTTGNSYTVAAALEGVKKAALLMGHSLKDVRAVVIGAAESAGRVCALLLARDVKKMTLAGGEKRGLEEAAGKIFFDTGLSAGITDDAGKALRVADVAVVAAGREGMVAGLEDLAPGTVVCLLAGPRRPAVRPVRPRDDVLVMEGGVVKVPGDVCYSFDPVLPPGTACPAMAETMILALEGNCGDFSPGGPATVRQVEKIAALAKKHGFKLAGFKSYGRFLAPAEVEKIKINAAKRLQAV
ncbi:MAG: shikimate dehydrogenase [Peptococcaceae bacterium]|nr:shikimate dehydrogenase [Peptococcaceae bacterium]